MRRKFINVLVGCLVTLAFAATGIAQEVPTHISGSQMWINMLKHEPFSGGSYLLYSTDSIYTSTVGKANTLTSWYNSLANAVEVYIDIGQGSDTTGTGSLVRPYKTLAYACAQYQTAPANWNEYNTPIVLHVAAGDYEDDVVFPRKNVVTLIADGRVRINGNIAVNKLIADFFKTAGSGRQSPATAFIGPAQAHYIGKTGLQINGDLTFRVVGPVMVNEWAGGVWQIVYSGACLHGNVNYIGANAGFTPTIMFAGSDQSDESMEYNILSSNNVKVTCYNHGLLTGQTMSIINGLPGINVTNWPVDSVIDRHNFTYTTPTAIPINYMASTPWVCKVVSTNGTAVKSVLCDPGTTFILGFDSKLTKRVCGNMKIIDLHDCRIGNIDYSIDPFGNPATNYMVQAFGAPGPGAYINGFKNCTFEGTVYKFGGYGGAGNALGFDSVSWTRIAPKNPTFTNLNSGGYAFLDTAAGIAFTPGSGVTASNVQAAITAVANMVNVRSNWYTGNFVVYGPMTNTLYYYQGSLTGMVAVTP